MTDYETAKTHQNELNRQVAAMSELLNDFPKTAMGLTTDEAKASTRYRYAREGYRVAFTRLQNFNRRFVKLYANEIRAERAARFTTQGA
jgi:hypothetical protein